MDIVTLVTNFYHDLLGVIGVFGYILSEIGGLFVNLLRPINYIFILIKNAVLGLGTVGVIDPNATFLFSSEVKNFLISIPGWLAFRVVLTSICYVLLAVAIIKKAHNVFT